MSKLGYYISRGATKIGLNPRRRLRLAIKTAKAKKKISNFAKKNPTATGISLVSAGAVATYPLTKNTEFVKSRQRMKLEAEKIRKELKSGKKLTFNEKRKRMSEAGKMRSFP